MRGAYCNSPSKLTHDKAKEDMPPCVLVCPRSQERSEGGGKPYMHVL